MEWRIDGSSIAFFYVLACLILSSSATQFDRSNDDGAAQDGDYDSGAVSATSQRWADVEWASFVSSAPPETADDAATSAFAGDGTQEEQEEEIPHHFAALADMPNGSSTNATDAEAEGANGELLLARLFAPNGTTVPRRKVLWEYCDGDATVSDKALYRVPGCHAPTMQTPKLNRSEVTYRAYELRNLSFCCKSNYTAILPDGTDVDAKDREAEYLYEEAKMGLLSRYPCDHFYPYHTCEPCLYSYRTWVCAITFPAMCRGADFPDEAIKVCSDVCVEVLRKCPSDFGLACPDDGSIYRDPSRIDLDHAISTLNVEDADDGVGVSSVGCNLMHYDLYARTGAVGRLASGGVGVLIIVALLTLVVLL